ncbi:MAG: hypothetical protein D6696_20770 [Acidobacteria bacterium]|nr:MAG: hypothetical protein D6696_20770 [Acidobacteriota bacterium]
MATRRTSWPQSLRVLSAALLEVLRAELALLTDECKNWGRRLAVAAGLVALAFGGLASLMLLLAYAGVRAAQSLFGLGPWQAPLAVAGVVLLAVLVLVGVAYLLLRRAEDPIRATRRRFADHRRWWQERVLAAGAMTAASGPPAADPPSRVSPEDDDPEDDDEG